MRARLAILAFALSIVASGTTVKPVAAATASAAISVSATVQASCLASVFPTEIGTRTREADVAPAVSVSCSNSVPYKITLNAGVARGASIATPLGPGTRFPLLSPPPRAFSGQAANPMIVVVTY
jgi:spore coat protein U-like protein